MATDVLMPRLSDSMEEGTVLKWLVDAGNQVKRGEPLVEIETDKANMTYEADTDGVLVEVVAAEGDTLAIGELIARIGEESEQKTGDGGQAAGGAGDGGEPQAEGESEGRDAEPVAPDGGPSGNGAGADADQPSGPPTSVPAATNGHGDEAGERIKASPVARRVANEMGVELQALEGSGPGGRIVKADVEAAAKEGTATVEQTEEPAAEPAPAGDGAGPADGGPPEAQAAGEAGAKGSLQVQELTRLQKTVSRRMAESKATAPDFQLNLDVDMSRCVELRERLKEVSDAPPSYNDMVVKACATGLREFPRVNGAYRDGRFELYGRVNVGVAVAAQGTLVVPTIFDADQKSLGAISRDARRLIDKVREGTITPPELSGGTFTVSNLGMFGIDSFTAVINPPQAAILSVGRVAKKAVVDDSGRVVARDTMSVTLTCDHRILYGADGAEFLARVAKLLEQPLSLAL